MAASRIAEAQECNRGEETQSFDGPISPPDECSLRRNALSVLCALGGKYHAKPVWFCFCFEMKGLGPVRDGIELDRHHAIPDLSHPRDVDLSPGTL